MSLAKIALGLLAIYLIVKLSKWLRERRRLVRAIDKLPGPSNIPFAPIINHALLIVYLDFLKHKLGTFTLAYYVTLYLPKCFPDTGILRFWLGLKPVVVLYSAENIESVLTSTTVLNKADEYRFFEPWIGEGLLTSKRAKWRFRRKILTPAFHFRILNDFLPIMNQEATKLIRKLNSTKFMGERGECKVFNVFPQMALCALDTICETAMGTNINCQADENSPYVLAVHEVGSIALSRTTRPWLWHDFVFNRTEEGKRFQKANKIMQAFTTKVILERKAAWESQLNLDNSSTTTKRAESITSAAAKSITVNNHDNNLPGNSDKEDREAEVKVKIDSIDSIKASSFFKLGNKRLAFLDLLLHQHLIENTMSIDDIREEVDTFMFAGHDTTAVTSSWALYMLGLYKDIQDRVRDELDRVILEDKTECTGIKNGGENYGHLAIKLKITDITVEQIREMKYLDRFLKESMRLWPSVPFVARQMTEDITVDGKYLVPKGATCLILMHALHNNPKYFPKPEIFDPDRFLPENSVGRHPFAYIPFSAGPRNCIGQKYGMMEVKIILAKIIRNYYIETYEHRDKLVVTGELVLRSQKGLNIRMIPRFR